MPCLDYGFPFGKFRVAESVETHGLDCGPYERFYEEFVICSDCDGRFDPADWDAADLENDTPEDVTDEANSDAENYATPRT